MRRRRWGAAGKQGGTSSLRSPRRSDSFGREAGHIFSASQHHLGSFVFQSSVVATRGHWSHINWGFTVESAVANITLMSDPCIVNIWSIIEPKLKLSLIESNVTVS